MLKIESTKAFKEANKKTSSVALHNLGGERPTSTPSENLTKLVSQQDMEKCLYGDIPEKYKYKQTEEDQGEQ